MHTGHEIVKCECGKIIRQCRCMNPLKSTVIQRPCKCGEKEKEEKTLQQKLAQVAHDTCVAHRGAHGCCYVVNLAVTTAIENYKES